MRLTKDRVLVLFPVTNIVRGLTFTKPDTPRAEFEPPPNLSSDSVECICAKIITSSISRELKCLTS